MPSLEELYEAQMGHPPPVDESDDCWQWEYNGRSELDKQRLLDMIQTEAEAEHEQGVLFP